MPISDPQVVKFANEKGRRLADLLGGVYLSLGAIVLAWDSQGLDAKCPEGGGVITDGADKDGRPPMDADQLRDLVSLARALKGRMDFLPAVGKEDREKFLSIAVNPEIRTI